jgi:hypothetical protein
MISHCGEVVESSLIHVVCVCWHEPCPVFFGNLVYIVSENKTFVGIVYELSVSSIQKDRLVHVFKKSIAELRLQQPQIFLFMHTYFSVYLIGEETESGYREGLQRAPLLHANIAIVERTHYMKYLQGDFLLRVVYSHASEFVRIQLLKKIFAYISTTGEALAIERYITILLDISNNDIALIRAICE